MDVWMEGQYSIKSAFQVAQLTLKYLEPEPKIRPSMKRCFWRCSKRVLGRLCWRNQNETICDPYITLVPAIIPRVAKSS
ncbi:LOW QUALITY PROTEIN: hypothetical protein TorRG33x02_004080 [Trema orientale]|uniref:Uncharacterized protein n=1 Tax=Trema orientale TaxID=63057 RepID=A0A2P5G214_TREOI|nr:LOW QUALITY PROTEIN: hypothetical protein TorRG33x02_004080 [Trema orientale]